MVEPELLHTYSRLLELDVVLLIVRLAVLTAVTLTVPVVLFPVSFAIGSALIKIDISVARRDRKMKKSLLFSVCRFRSVPR